MTLTWGDFLSCKDVRIEEYIPKDIQELLFPNPTLETRDETTNEERNELKMMAKMYPASLGSEQDEIVQFSYMRKRVRRRCDSKNIKRPLFDYAIDCN